MFWGSVSRNLKFGLTLNFILCKETKKTVSSHRHNNICRHWIETMPDKQGNTRTMNVKNAPNSNWKNWMKKRKQSNQKQCVNSEIWLNCCVPSRSPHQKNQISVQQSSIGGPWSNNLTSMHPFWHHLSRSPHQIRKKSHNPFFCFPKSLLNGSQHCTWFDGCVRQTNRAMMTQSVTEWSAQCKKLQQLFDCDCVQLEATTKCV